jgi:putative DNA primase/helicase
MSAASNILVPTFSELEAHGWKLCAIERGKKGPIYEGWNTSPMPAESIDALGVGAGVLHSLSGTCALDIDDMEPARAWWAERGVDIDALRSAPDSVHISSGRAGRDKLLYQLSKPMRTVKPKGHGFELRCATAGGESVQDVLPPSIHPITKKPYEWAYGEPLIGHWTNLPNIPAPVYAVWRELVESEPVTEVVNEKPQEQPITLVRKAVLAFIESRKLDMDNYDDWISIGMRIHKQTEGGLQGFGLWSEVSKTSPKYAGIEDLRRHWDSFRTDGALGLDAAIRELPATADEFDIVEGADMRPVVSLDGGELHKNAAQCEANLADELYVRDRQLVRIGGAKEVAPERDGVVRRDDSQAAIIPATPEYLRRRLNERVRFRKYRHREKSYGWVDCPRDLPLNIAGQGDWPTFRRLDAIARAPYVRSNGSICETPGYDENSRVFYQPNAEFPSIPNNPTRDDAAYALGVLLRPFEEFPFATEPARSGFVAHILTEVVRAAIGTSPIFFYTAPTPGTGKTLLSEMPSRIVHGGGPALRPWVEGEELRKNLFSSLLAGDRTIGFDNLPNGAKVRSSVLCSFATAETYSDRKLGASEAPSLPNRSVVFLTGNNLTPVGDLARRSIVIRLDADTTNLRDRRFLITDLRAYVAAHRPDLLVAALTIIGAYVASGEMSGEPPLPSFEEWSRFVREPMRWLGLADPVETQDDEADDEVAPLIEAFALIAAAVGEREFTASDLVQMCDPLLATDGEKNALAAALEAAGCSDPTGAIRVGYWLREKRDRIAGGWKLVRGSETRGAGHKWRLRVVS